jgi:hypothetical protein
VALLQHDGTGGVINIDGGRSTGQDMMIDVLRAWRPDTWPLVPLITGLLPLPLVVTTGGTAAAEEINTKLADAKSSMTWDFVSGWRASKIMTADSSQHRSLTLPLHMALSI